MQQTMVDAEETGVNVQAHQQESELDHELANKLKEIDSIINSIYTNMRRSENDWAAHETIKDNVAGINDLMNSDEQYQCQEFYELIRELFYKAVDRHIEFKPCPVFDIDMEEEEPMIYRMKVTERNCILQLIINLFNHPKLNKPIAKKVFDQLFVARLLKLFYAEDYSERDLLKNCLHCIYRVFISFRPKIRYRIKNMFIEIEQSNPRPHCRGLPQLLDLVASIVNGYVIPIKDEHKAFLQEGLIPLLKMPNLKQYDDRLRNCFHNYSAKDTECLLMIMSAIFKYWPHLNPWKEIIFMENMVFFLDFVQPENFINVQEKVFQKLYKAMSSPACNVVEQCHAVIKENSSIHKLIERDPVPVLKEFLKRKPHLSVNDYNHRLMTSFQMLEDHLLKPKFEPFYHKAITELEENDEEFRRIRQEYIQNENKISGILTMHSMDFPSSMINEDNSECDEDEDVEESI